MIRHVELMNGLTLLVNRSTQFVGWCNWVKEKFFQLFTCENPTHTITSKGTVFVFYLSYFGVDNAIVNSENNYFYNGIIQRNSMQNVLYLLHY